MIRAGSSCSDPLTRREQQGDKYAPGQDETAHPISEGAGALEASQASDAAVPGSASDPSGSLGVADLCELTRAASCAHSMPAMVCRLVLNVWLCFIGAQWMKNS